MAIDHEREVRPHGGQFDVDPDLAVYRKVDEAGALVVVTARDGATLVGYALSIVMPHHYYRGLVWASGDGLWLTPAYRRPRIADRMLAFAEDSLRAKGVVLNVIGVHPDHPALGRLLVRRGYALSSLGHSRRL